MSFDIGDRGVPAIVGFWDYTWDEAGRQWVVVVDAVGAGVIECATTPGNQLIHLQCQPGGPCQVHRGTS
jgi:hypothetical protein